MGHPKMETGFLARYQVSRGVRSKMKSALGHNSTVQKMNTIYHMIIVFYVCSRLEVLALALFRFLVISTQVIYGLWLYYIYSISGCFQSQ